MDTSDEARRANPHQNAGGSSDASAADVPECVECGACCFFEDPRYVMVFEDDFERLGARAAELTHWVGGRTFMRVEAGHCAALRVEPQGRYVCSVYGARPRLCREFERLSSMCRSSRANNHSRTVLALDLVRRLTDPST